ncbi:MAG: hypothetical protein C0481_21055 [Phenylobacterium sp.]|uniref:hypothetical protein n=1 Tax=Phenylobacterium sp. TaxID=1871053 RepID=UPI0025E863FD|nr:hypothetical protein [Phenylobacterium sp.]MBA4014355.1 hypothetical protein [Phenylobacterium sp.]
MSNWKFGGLVALAAFGVSSAVMAEDAPPAKALAAAEELDVAPMGDAELGAISGGQSVVVEALSNQQLSASNSGSVQADQVATGNVDFSTGDYSGIGNFVVNTGNNNNLQGVISVNIATLGGP